MSSKAALVCAVAIVAIAMSLSIVQAKERQATATPMVFQIPDTCKIHLADETVGKLADVKVGEKVGVAYDSGNGALTAVAVHVVVPKGEKPKGEHQKGKKQQEQKPKHQHAHGNVTAVDLTAKTLTVEAVAHHSPAK